MTRVSVALCGSFAAVLALTIGCESPPPKRKAPRLFEQVLELNLIQEPELDVEAARAAFGRIVEEARRQIEGKTRPREIIGALNRVILMSRRVEYLSETQWRDSTLAAALLRKRGNCLAASTLYFLVARELGLPVRPVEMPKHLFVRWDDGTSRVNIETTARGAETRDLDYEALARSTYAEVVEAGWGRQMTDDEFLAKLAVNAARHYVGQSRQEEALPLVERALFLTNEKVEYQILRCQVKADITGEREKYRKKIDRLRERLRSDSHDAVWALMLRARELSGVGEHERARELLSKTFARARRSQLPALLTQLAFCHRALRDHRGAVRYMELAAVLEPDDAGTLYNLAILQEDDGRLDEALETIRRALEINPSSWNLQVMQAGYTIMAGEPEKGLELFAKVERPRADEEFYDIMVAWFYAVAANREEFYAALEHALGSARTTGILSWIDEDRDLDPYRDDPEFTALVERHRARLLGGKTVPGTVCRDGPTGASHKRFLVPFPPNRLGDREGREAGAARASHGTEK